MPGRTAVGRTWRAVRPSDIRRLSSVAPSRLACLGDLHRERPRSATELLHRPFPYIGLVRLTSYPSVFHEEPLSLVWIVDFGYSFFGITSRELLVGM